MWTNLLPSTDNRDPTVYLGPPDAFAPKGRLEIKIPWRSNKRPKRNFNHVWARDNATVKKLSTEELNLYRSAIQKLVDSGFATPTKKNGDMHYIACRPVIKKSRVSTKCRLCLDAREINRYTYPGLTFCQPIANCLIKFRAAKYVVLYDLCQAFWQLRYHSPDRGWFCTILEGQPLSFERMVFGANFSPSGLEVALNFLHRRAQEYLLTMNRPEPDEPVRPADLNNVFSYVDDFAHVGDDMHEVLTQSCWYRWWLNNHGFPSDKVVNNLGNDGLTTYLGYQYDTKTDTLKAIIPQMDPSTIPLDPQLHQVVALISRLYDPLGLELHLQLFGRAIVREAFARIPNGPDVPNQSESQSKWLSTSPGIGPLIEEFVKRLSIELHSVKRATVPNELNVFTDASSVAWVFEIRDANYELVCAKGGLVCPSYTIPRNELIATHAATTFLKGFVETVPVKQITIFTDSLCTVQRLNAHCNEKVPAFEEIRD